MKYLYTSLFVVIFFFSFLSLLSFSSAACFLAGPLASSDTSGTVASTDTVSIIGSAAYCGGCYVSPYGDPTYLSYSSKTPDPVVSSNSTTTVSATYNCIASGTNIPLKLQLRACPDGSSAIIETTVTCNVGACSCSSSDYVAGACDGVAYGTDCNSAERIYTCDKCKVAKCVVEDSCKTTTMQQCKFTLYSSDTSGTVASTDTVSVTGSAKDCAGFYISPSGTPTNVLSFNSKTSSTVQTALVTATYNCVGAGTGNLFIQLRDERTTSPTYGQKVDLPITTVTCNAGACSCSSTDWVAGQLGGSAYNTQCNSAERIYTCDKCKLAKCVAEVTTAEPTTSCVNACTSKEYSSGYCTRYSCASGDTSIYYSPTAGLNTKYSDCTTADINCCCKGVPTVTCKSSGQSCTYSTDCCSGLSCINGKCSATITPAYTNQSVGSASGCLISYYQIDNSGTVGTTDNIKIVVKATNCNYYSLNTIVKEAGTDSYLSRVSRTPEGSEITTSGTVYTTVVYKCLNKGDTTKFYAEAMGGTLGNARLADITLNCAGAATATTTQQTTAGINATVGQTYGDYTFYAVTGVKNNWAMIKVKHKFEAIVDEQVISQNDAKDFSTIGVRVKVLSVDALPDGTVRGVVIEITPITKAETGTAALTSPVEFGDYRIYTKSGVTNSWVLLIIEDKNGREIDMFTINQGETRDSSFAKLRIKVTRVARTQDGGLVNADLEVSEIPQEATEIIGIEKPKVKCTDTDLGKNYYKKGSGTGMYAGSSPPGGHIFGEDPNKASFRISEEYNYDIAYDHCEDSATSNELNEVFCDSEGRLQIEAYSCPRGCKDGVCLGKTISERIGETVFSIIGQRAATTATQETVSVQVECMPGVSKCVVKDRRIVKNNPELFFYKCGNDGKWEITECFRPTIQFLTNTYTTYETCNPVVGCMSMIEYDRLVFDLENIMYQTSENKKKLRKCDECNPNDFACVCGDVDKADIENIQIKPGYWCKDGKSSENRLEVGCEPQGVLNYDVKEYCAGSGGECVEEGLPGFKKYTYKQCVEGKLNTIRCSGKCNINLGCVEGSETTTIPTGAFISILGKSS